MTNDTQQSIRLLVRGDDIGSSHAANLACMDAYTKGIMRSVELMVVCPWFPEAVRLLNKHPELDVGVHCTLTSEWDAMKWRPLTTAPSITDENGFFFPMIHPNNRFPPEKALRTQDWKLEEIDRELRAQVELARRNVPHITHMTCHMGCSSWDDSVKEVFEGIAAENGLLGSGVRSSYQRFDGYRDAEDLSQREEMFIRRLDQLSPGDWMFVDHPAYDTPEMRAIGHSGYEDVAADRDSCTRVFTSETVRSAIEERGIKLISYRDLA